MQAQEVRRPRLSKKQTKVLNIDAYVNPAWLCQQLIFTGCIACRYSPRRDDDGARARDDRYDRHERSRDHNSDRSHRDSERRRDRPDSRQPENQTDTAEPDKPNDASLVAAGAAPNGGAAKKDGPAGGLYLAPFKLRMVKFPSPVEHYDVWGHAHCMILSL